MANSNPNPNRRALGVEVAPRGGGGIQWTWILTVFTLVAAALYYCVGVLWIRGQRHQGVPSFDLYASFVPNIEYALWAVRQGEGLLWNPYQNCGHPFFADSLTGLLYPTNVFFALLDREAAILAAVLVNLLIGGLGMYALCREMGLGVTAALCGALAFQLGGTSSQMAAWTPTNIAVYAWMPVAMWRLERLLHRPTFANSAWLGLALSMQLLPGYPQPLFFTYQLIALRTVWAVFAVRPRPLFTTVGLIIVAGILPVLVTAIQFLPSVELARDSVRGVPLTATDIGRNYSWEELRTALGGTPKQPYPGNVITAAVLGFCCVAIARWKRATLAVFYLIVAAGYTLLSFGPDSYLYPMYAQLPFGSTFRMPMRFLWVAGYAFAALSAFGVAALLRQEDGSSVRRRAYAGSVLVLGVALFFIVARRLPMAPEWAVLVGVLLAAVWFMGGQRRPALAVLIVLVVTINVAAVSRWTVSSWRPGDIYGANKDAFALLHTLMTPQDRVALVGARADFALMLKSASLFKVPSILDYAPQASRTYADFYTWLRVGKPVTRLNDWYYPIAGVLPKGFSEPLFNLTAARFVLVGREMDGKFGRGTSWREVRRTKRWTLYENPSAFARARFVPRVAVVRPERVLPMLAMGHIDATKVAVVSQQVSVPPDTDGSDGSSDIRIAVDRPEYVEIHVQAPSAGFLYLADQYAPGWEAVVNGASTEILRANGTFRAVAVPAGPSKVEFTYRPRSVQAGGVLSLATILSIGGVFFVRRARSRREG